MPNKSKRWLVRTVIFALFIGFAWHGWATVAWLSGSDKFMSIGPVKAYADPAFRQNWSVFAPDPDDLNIKLQVRAELQNGEVSDWFDVTEQDLLDSIQGVPVLSRMYQNNFILVHYALSDANLVSAHEREIVRSKEYISNDSDIRAALESSGFDTDERILARVLNENKSLTMISSEVAKVRWGDGDENNIKLVQYRVLVVMTPRVSWRDHEPDPYLFDWLPGWREPIWHGSINSDEFERRYGPNKENDGASRIESGEVSTVGELE